MDKRGGFTVRLARGRRLKMDDVLFQVLYAAGAFDDPPSERRKPGQAWPEERGVFLRVLVAALVVLAVAMALIMVIANILR